MKHASPDLSLILPCYNEAGLLIESVRRIRAVLDTSRYTYEIIFVDDGSSDGTPDLIASYCRKANPRGRGALTPGVERGVFRALFHRKNRGRGRTVVDGIKAAKGKVAGYIDIDCEVSPVYIPAMVTRILRGEADVVIGRRYYRTSPRAAVREVLSRGYQWLSDTLVGTGGLDTETGYKFFRRTLIVPMLDSARHSGWFWDTEIMVYARRAGLTIVEMPVLFLRRFDKVSSVHVVRDTLDYMIQLWAFRKRLQAQLI